EWPRRFGALAALVATTVVGAALVQNRFSGTSILPSPSTTQSAASPDRSTPSDGRRGGAPNAQASATVTSEPKPAGARQNGSRVERPENDRGGSASSEPAAASAAAGGSQREGRPESPASPSARSGSSS